MLILMCLTYSMLIVWPSIFTPVAVFVAPVVPALMSLVIVAVPGTAVQARLMAATLFANMLFGQLALLRLFWPVWRLWGKSDLSRSRIVTNRRGSHATHSLSVQAKSLNDDVLWEFLDHQQHNEAKTPVTSIAVWYDGFVPVAEQGILTPEMTARLGGAVTKLYLRSMVSPSIAVWENVLAMPRVDELTMNIWAKNGGVFEDWSAGNRVTCRLRELDVNFTDSSPTDYSGFPEASSSLLSGLLSGHAFTALQKVTLIGVDLQAHDDGLAVLCSAESKLRTVSLTWCNVSCDYSAFVSLSNLYWLRIINRTKRPLVPLRAMIDAEKLNQIFLEPLDRTSLPDGNAIVDKCKQEGCIQSRNAYSVLSISGMRNQNANRQMYVQLCQLFEGERAPRIKNAYFRPGSRSRNHSLQLSGDGSTGRKRRVSSSSDQTSMSARRTRRKSSKRLDARYK